MTNFNFKNKVVIVTGAGQGIGRGIALAFAKAGAKVVVADITDKINDVAGEIGANALPVRLDVSKLADAENAVKQTLEKFGRIDVLVNNAGIYPFKPVAEMAEAEWDKVININLKGIFNCTKAVLPHMIKQKNGNIVNIASVAGAVLGFPYLVHYSSSKGGVMGFTRSAALEFADHNIRVNAIAPGAIKTPGTAGTSDEVLKQMEQTIPIKRLGTPEDIADAVLFLASDASSYITGQCITVDGGKTLVF